MIRRGDLLLFISYVPDGEGYHEHDSKEPCLCIAKANAGRAMGKVFVLAMSVAWKYMNADGHMTPFCYERAAEIADLIGLGDGIHARRQVFGAIADYMPELLRAAEFDMVSAERHTQKAYGELTAFVEGERVGHTEMMH